MLSFGYFYLLIKSYTFPIFSWFFSFKAIKIRGSGRERKIFMSNVKLPTLEDLLKAGAHFGHTCQKRHPKMSPYIFAKRDGINIIDLSKTEECLAKALNFLEEIAEKRGVILFVGTKKQIQKIITDSAEAVGMPYIKERWLGGTLTNFAEISKLIKKYQSLLRKKESGELKKYTKLEQLEFDREIARLDEMVGGLVRLEKVPTAIVMADLKKDKIVLPEAKRKKIPVVAICDTNTNPEQIQYPIPANDDSTKTTKLIFSLIAEAIKFGASRAAAVKEVKPAKEVKTVKDEIEIKPTEKKEAAAAEIKVVE